MRFHFVDYFAADDEFRFRRIEIRVDASVPQPDVRNGQFLVVAALGDYLVRRVEHRDFHVALAGHESFGFHYARHTFHGGRDLYSGRAGIVEIEVILIDDYEIDVAVYAAVESEVGRLRIYRFVGAVVHFHFQLVVVQELFGDVDAEFGVASVVAAHFLAVERHFARRVDALEFEVDLLAVRHFGTGDRALVLAHEALVVVAAVLSVHAVPGMRHVDVRHRTFFGEFPAFVEIDKSSHIGSPFAFSIIISHRTSLFNCIFLSESLQFLHSCANKTA